ncbi:MAG: hypothetical protein IPN20_01255 [Haliscomenobacter sp.]|nr:hypothetical protein [Haliscomenobacter sp.]
MLSKSSAVLIFIVLWQTDTGRVAGSWVLRILAGLLIGVHTSSLWFSEPHSIQARPVLGLLFGNQSGVLKQAGVQRIASRTLGLWDEAAFQNKVGIIIYLKQ